VPAMPIDNLNLAAAPTANAAPPSDVAGKGEDVQSFQATLAKEIRNQGGDAKSEAPAAKKPDDSSVADPAQPADPTQADLLIAGLIKPQLASSAEPASPQNDLSDLAAGAAPNTGASPIDLVNAAKAQALLADQMPARTSAVAEANDKVDDAARPALELAARGKQILGLKRDASPAEDTARPRGNGFWQGLDRALQQAATNKSESPPVANPSLNELAAAERTAGSAVTLPRAEAMNLAKAAGQASEEKRAASADVAAAMPGKELAKPLDGPKHDPAPGLMGDIRAAANVQAAASQAPSNLSATSLRIDASVGTAAWSSALGQQVILMAAGQQQQAEIHLNPENLGPIKVTITLDNNQASLSFVAREVSVRDAIEASLPKLTSMMSESGISLGQTNVSADHSGNPTPWSLPETAGNGGPIGDAGETAMTLPGTGTRIRVQQGLIDTFA